MKIVILSTLLILASSATAAPTAEAEAAVKARADRGSYIVSGLGSRKIDITNAGGNDLDISIAMLETERISTDYAYGDSKTQDSANFGVFKQNWGMMRVCGSRYGFAGQSQADWNNGNRLNSDMYADVATRWDCQNYYGYDIFMAGHRNGASGLANPYTQDITNYKDAISWINSQINSDRNRYMTDDTRFWVDVPAI